VFSLIVEYHKSFSSRIGREMEFKVYGHGGKPVIVFPSSGGRFYEYEDFRMVDACASFIERGIVRLYAVDSIDRETWSAASEPPYDRVRRHEAWFNYLIEELYPSAMQETGWPHRAMTMGFSMGAMHAVNTLFRRPDLFDTVIALSGAYQPEHFLGDYMDEVVYRNSPVSSIRGMPHGHPWIELLNTCKIVICVGQGAWEEEMLASTRLLDRALYEKGIHAWIDYWGTDVSHDWPWWHKQLPYFLSKVME